MACIRKKDPAQCGGQVYVNLFFDGTGNNMDWQEPGLGTTQMAAGKHSNIARLYNAAIDDPEDGFFARYIPGLGTPFAEIGDTGGALGLAAGYMGADRINWAITRILDSVHEYLTERSLFGTGQARTIVNNASKTGFETWVRRQVLGSWEKKLEAVVKNRERKVTHINVAVFGFSRGAATARVFANWLLQWLEQEDGGYRLAGIPLRIYFMGLFDTVASVGVADMLPGFDGRMDWATPANLEIHPAVEQCVHFVALHEQRASFPLELAARATQVAYPGMHSDVGGGYRPGEQGKAMPGGAMSSPHLSQVPLIDMHHAALVGGVPLMSMEEIKETPDVAPDFDCPPALAAAVNNFFDHCGIKTSAKGKDGVVAVLRSHTLQYLQWRDGLLRPGRLMENRRFFREAHLRTDRAQLREALKDFTAQLVDLRVWAQDTGVAAVALDGVARLNPIAGAVLRTTRGRRAGPVDAETLRMLEAVSLGATLPPAVQHLMDDYIHDSRAGFRIGGMMEPRELTDGYFRYRRVF
jgi:Fe-S cluster biosynthesis and repair protein YggX